MADTKIPPSGEKEVAPTLDSTLPSDEEATFKDTTLPPWRFWTLSIGIGLGLFLAMIDTSIVATSLFTIGEEFDSLENINWVALAYTLAYLGCAVIFSRMADVVGRRNAFLAAFVIFFGFSLAAGFSSNINQLIAFRALQGIGGSGLYSLSMVIWPEIASESLKQYIAGLAGVVVAVAGVLGPILGGLLTHYASWRWVFWINGPIGIVSMVIFAVTWPKAEYLPDIERRSWKNLDFLGSFLLIAAAVLVTFAFQNAGSDIDQWGQAIFIAPLVAGVFCWMALFAWQYLIELWWKNKLMAAFPLVLLRNRIYRSGALNAMFLGFPFYIIVFNFPLRLQVVNGQSPLLSGVMLLPMLAGVAIGTFVGGGINNGRNRIFETLAGASALMLLGCGLETTLSSSGAIEPKALGFLTFIGFGFGMTASSSAILTAIEAPISEHAPAQGIVAQLRVLGGSIGIAASSAILATQEKNHLTGVVPPGAVAMGTGLLTEAQQAVVRQTYSDAFTQDMRVATILVAVGLLVSLGTYQTNRLTMHEMRELQVRQEKERRRESPAPAGHGASA